MDSHRFIKIFTALSSFIFSFFITFSGNGLHVSGVNAQILKPVKWSFSVDYTSGDEAKLIFTPKIDKGWHLYSLFIEEGGPIPTSFTIDKSSDFELMGKVSEQGKSEEVFDPNFNMKLKYFSEKVTFTQKLKIKSGKAFKVKGKLEFMTCDDKQCLPPDEVPFEFTITPVLGNVSKEEASNEAVVINENPDTGKTADAVVQEDIIPEDNSTITPVEKEAGMSLLSIFIGGFLGGLLALLTPCVFPMIPLTVSFFTKRTGSTSKAIGTASVYGLSIIVIYVGLGLLVTKLLGADALNDLASNGIFNMLFFVLFVIFAASFFGAFEIQFPHSWTNAAFIKSEQGGLMGIFFMAFTLALVSFSCTGPIIGTLLVEAAVGGHDLNPLIGMFGFSLALAIPFALFAAFPAWLHALPKSGGWLNSVKVVLGFLELALALKFLSNVDLAYHWGILDREVFLALWIIIFALLGLYLLGKLKFSHDSHVQHISIPRFFLALISLSFSLYMVPGLWGAPLKAISAFSPPQGTQDFDLSKGRTAVAAVHDMPVKKYASERTHCPHDINCFFDYEQGVDYARKHNKPVMIDFTGWTCVNCRKMEASVWSEPAVLDRLNNDYVVISLYVDDKRDLPANEQYESIFSGKTIRTIGNKWSDFQGSKFGTNSQPYYVLLDHNGNMLTKPHAFDLDVQTFVSFLDTGKSHFEKNKLTSASN